MATTPNSAITPQTPEAGPVQIVPADTTTQKSVFAAGANGAKITGVVACSDDTAARVLQLSILRSAVNYVLGSVNVPALSGTDGIAPTVNLLDPSKIPGLPVDNDGQPHILLESGDTLQVKTLVTVTAAKTIHVVSFGGNF